MLTYKRFDSRWPASFLDGELKRVISEYEVWKRAWRCFGALPSGGARNGSRPKSRSADLRKPLAESWPLYTVIIPEAIAA